MYMCTNSIVVWPLVITCMHMYEKKIFSQYIHIFLNSFCHCLLIKCIYIHYTCHKLYRMGDGHIMQCIYLFTFQTTETYIRLPDQTFYTEVNVTVTPHTLWLQSNEDLSQTSTFRSQPMRKCIHYICLLVYMCR